jgi:hypothetical protein
MSLLDNYSDLIDEAITQRENNLALGFYGSDLVCEGVECKIKELDLNKRALNFARNIIADVLSEVERRTHGRQ